MEFAFCEEYFIGTVFCLLYVKIYVPKITIKNGLAVFSKFLRGFTLNGILKHINK